MKMSVQESAVLFLKKSPKQIYFPLLQFCIVAHLFAS